MTRTETARRMTLARGYAYGRIDALLERSDTYTVANTTPREVVAMDFVMFYEGRRALGIADAWTAFLQDAVV